MSIAMRSACRRIACRALERLKLTARMGVRRPTRLTKGFSRTLEDRRDGLALHFFHNNWIRTHKTTR